jgi:hypothetical protein
MHKNPLYIRALTLAQLILLDSQLSKKPNKCKLTNDEILRVAAALTLRIDPITACTILKNSLNSKVQCSRLIYSWSNLCKAWKLYDDFRNNPSDLSKLAAAYKELYNKSKNKGIPDVYIQLATYLLKMCAGCLEQNNTTNSRLFNICPCIKRILYKRGKLRRGILECISNALSKSGFRVRRRYYWYKECRQI